MGNPIDQAAAPVGMSKGGGAGGSSRGHHRQSLSISSLPLEKLARINCDKRTSVSAVNSPRSSSTVTQVEKPQQSIASFLGQVDSSRSRKPSRSINAAATELASKSDRKPSSFNPFRGHRRVGSGSNVVAKAAWDYSPRLKAASSCSSASAASSPKKLVDKYAVSKIAASLFHSPAKLERSMSLTRAASHRASSVVVQAKLNVHTVAAVGEIISSASSDAAIIPRNSSSCNSDHGGQQAPSHSSPANIKDAANPSSAQSAMLNSPEFESAAEILEGGESVPDANMEVPASPSTISVAALFEETTGGPTTTKSNLSEDYYAKVTTEEELTEAAVRCSIPSSSDGGNNSPDMDSPGVSTEQEVRNKKRDFMMLRVSSAPRAMSMSSPGSSSSSSHEVKMSVMKSTLRKRRRSASASGIGAMLLKVVRVPESGTIVARKFVGSSSSSLSSSSLSSSSDAALDCSFSVEKSTSSPVQPVGRLGDCETDLPDDAVKSTYSKFVDIEIYPAHGCVELVQLSKDGVDDDPSLKKTRLGASSARFSHLPPVKINSCAVHEGKTKARKMKTIRRGKMTSIDMDTLKEYLKTTDSDSCGALPQVDTPRSEPSPPLSSPPSSSPPSSSPPSPPQQVLESNLSMREKSRTCVSRLQAPSSGAYSYVDIYRPCSVSILANPSFSSSHQDKIWEEQAEIYSSGGRGTPGREDESAATPSSMQQPPTPAAASTTLLYSLHHSPSPSGFGSSNGNSQQPHEHHSAMRNSKGLGSGLSIRAGSPSSESGHFVHHIMSRIRGTSPKSVNAAASAASGGNNNCPKSSQSMEISKRRNPWSSCICFSVKS